MLHSKYLTEEGLKMLLNDLYESGTRYMYRPTGYALIYLFQEQPHIHSDGEIEDILEGSQALPVHTVKLLDDIFENTNCINLSVVLQKVDWSTVKVDTPVLVGSCADGQLTRRYFAGYNDGHVYTWDGGATSWSTDDENQISWWNYAKLAED